MATVKMAKQTKPIKGATGKKIFDLDIRSITSGRRSRNSDRPSTAPSSPQTGRRSLGGENHVGLPKMSLSPRSTPGNSPHPSPRVGRKSTPPVKHAVNPKLTSLSPKTSPVCSPQLRRLRKISTPALPSNFSPKLERRNENVKVRRKSDYLAPNIHVLAIDTHTVKAPNGLFPSINAENGKSSNFSKRKANGVHGERHKDEPPSDTTEAVNFAKKRELPHASSAFRLALCSDEDSDSDETTSVSPVQANDENTSPSPDIDETDPDVNTSEIHTAIEIEPKPRISPVIEVTKADTPRSTGQQNTQPTKKKERRRSHFDPPIINVEKTHHQKSQSKSHEHLNLSPGLRRSRKISTGSMGLSLRDMNEVSFYITKSTTAAESLSLGPRLTMKGVNDLIGVQPKPKKHVTNDHGHKPEKPLVNALRDAQNCRYLRKEN